MSSAQYIHGLFLVDGKSFAITPIVRYQQHCQNLMQNTDSNIIRIILHWFKMVVRAILAESICGLLLKLRSADF